MSNISENETWIKELKSKIVAEDDKILFNEASGCFLSGHFRAAYILSWISLVESLKRKIKLLANIGDNRAIGSDKKIEGAEAQKYSADRLIFEEANKCGIIDNADLSTINYLWEQRCLFAHPYNKQPEIDEVKHIIGQSNKLVLSKPLVYNKDFLEEHAKNIATKPFFLPTDHEQIQTFAKQIIARTPELLHPFFFKSLLYQASQICLDEEKLSEFIKLRFYLVELIKSTSISLEDSNWSMEHRVTNYPYECVKGFVQHETWPILPCRIKEMIIGYIESESNGKKLYYLKIIIKGLIEKNALEQNYVERYNIKLETLAFDLSINFYGSSNDKFKRLAGELLSYKYEQQNSVIEYLKKENGNIFIKELIADNQFYLGRLLRASAINGHWKTQNLIQSIANNSINVPNNVKAGIAYGSLVDTRDKISLNTKTLKMTVQLLNQIDDIIQNNVYELVNNILDNTGEDDWEMVNLNEEEFTILAKSIIENLENPSDNNIAKFEQLTERVKISLAQNKPLEL